MLPIFNIKSEIPKFFKHLVFLLQIFSNTSRDALEMEMPKVFHLGWLLLGGRWASPTQSAKGK